MGEALKTADLAMALAGPRHNPINVAERLRRWAAADILPAAGGGSKGVPLEFDPHAAALAAVLLACADVGVDDHKRLGNLARHMIEHDLVAAAMNELAAGRECAVRLTNWRWPDGEERICFAVLFQDDLLRHEPGPPGAERATDTVIWLSVHLRDFLVSNVVPFKRKAAG